MPKSPQPPTNPNHQYNLTARIPGWLKQQIITHINTKGVSLNQWLISVVVRALRDDWGVPEPPPAVRGLPTVADEIRAYAVGERLTGPCGRVVGECVAVGVGGVGVAGGLGFCVGCGVRVV